jgi:hypothetical protein
MLMEADLPEDLAALRAFALEESRKLAELMAAKGEADAEIERLQSIIDAFMRHRFGPRSEQLDPEQLQLGLEDVETALGQARADRYEASGRARPTEDRSRLILNGSNRLSMSRTRLAPAAAARSTSSARMLRSASMSCRPPSVSSSRAGRDMAAVRARAQWYRPLHRQGSSKAAFPPRR